MVETLFRWGGKCLHFCMTNLLRTTCTKFYHNRSSFVHCISKNILVCFFGSQCRWNSMGSVDSYASACCDFGLWLFHIISMSQAQLHTWPNFGKISSNIYEGIVCVRYIMFIACCVHDLWPLIPRANQHIYEPKYICDQNWVKFPSLTFWPHNLISTSTNALYICDQNWVKFPSLVYKMCSQGFRVIARCDLDLWPFDPKIWSAHLRTDIHMWQN